MGFSEFNASPEGALQYSLNLWRRASKVPKILRTQEVVGGLDERCFCVVRNHPEAQQFLTALEEGTGEERVTVIDSATACGGLGMMMLGAAAVARAGGDRAAVEARAREAREHLKVWFAIDTMEFLRRGGRVGAARAWLGSTLKIKPILTVESEITPIERVRTSRRAFERMVDYLRSRHEDGADGWMVQHIQAREQAEEMVARGREIFGSEPLLVGEVGPVIGTHVGPGLLGVGGVPKRLLEP